MRQKLHKYHHTFVSLFTREWIEIPLMRGYIEQWETSPSLRGSGLK